MLHIRLKKVCCLLLIVIILSCTSETTRLNEIKKLSKVAIPDHSSLLVYEDDLETGLVFKIVIEKKKVNSFFKAYHFKQVDTLKTNPLAKTSTDKYNLYYVGHSFLHREKIFGKDLHIFKNNRCTLIVDRETSVLWGLINYN